jgi:hypothetical protein
MPANLPIYQIPENPLDSSILDAFLRVDEALSRLDERARWSPLQAAWSQRLLYRNACAAMHTQNCLVHLEDLVLLDGHAFSGTMVPELSASLGILKFWQAGLREDAAMLLRSPMPGEMPRPAGDPLASQVPGDPMAPQDVPDFFWDPDWDEPGRLQQWRRVWQATDRLPPLLAAAIVWDAWHTLHPEQQGTWRSTLLASLVMRARDKTRHLLLPLDTGQRLSRKRWDVRDDTAKRMTAFFDMVACAVQAAGNELDSLSSANERMRLKIKNAPKNSRLPALADLMVARPIVSIPLACKELRISKQALRVMIPRLGSTPREITERRRYRCWSVV